VSLTQTVPFAEGVICTDATSATSDLELPILALGSLLVEAEPTPGEHEDHEALPFARLASREHGVVEPWHAQGVPTGSFATYHDTYSNGSADDQSLHDY